ISHEVAQEFRPPVPLPGLGIRLGLSVPRAEARGCNPRLLRSYVAVCATADSLFQKMRGLFPWCQLKSSAGGAGACDVSLAFPFWEVWEAPGSKWLFLAAAAVSAESELPVCQSAAFG